MDRINLSRARELNDREPPENLIRSGCARVLVTDLIAEVQCLREHVAMLAVTVGESPETGAAHIRAAIIRLLDDRADLLRQVALPRIPCRACGQIVPEARTVYATPMCHACLPPPPPLETIKLRPAG